MWSWSSGMTRTRSPAVCRESGLPARFVVNRDYDRGQLSSLLAGLDVVDRPGVAAVLVTLVDVPLVSAATVRAVIDCYRRTRAPIVRPTSRRRATGIRCSSIGRCSPRCAQRIRRRARNRSCARTRLPPATSPSTTRARSRISIRKKTIEGRSVSPVASAATRAIAERLVPTGGSRRKSSSCAVGVAPHLGHRVTLGDQPGADA